MTQLTSEFAEAPSQADMILEYLKTGACLTPLEALKRFGCFRLGARIWELKKAYQIKKTMVEVGKGKRVAQYSLVE